LMSTTERSESVAGHTALDREGSMAEEGHDTSSGSCSDGWRLGFTGMYAGHGVWIAGSICDTLQRRSPFAPVGFKNCFPVKCDG
jgi:hypothetical protein